MVRGDGLVQVPLLDVHVHHANVAQDHGHLQNTPDRPVGRNLADDALHSGQVPDVTWDGLDGTAGSLELREQGLVGLGPAGRTRHEDQVPGAVVDHPGRDGPAEAASAAHQKIRLVCGKGRGGHGLVDLEQLGVLPGEAHDDLAYVLAPLHVPESILDLVGSEDGARQRLDLALLVQLDHEVHQPRDGGMVDLAEPMDVDAEKSTVVLEQVHGQLAAAHHVALADLDHASTRGHTAPGRMQELARHRVQDAVDAAPAGGRKEPISKGRIARVEDALARDPVLADQILDLLGRAHGGVDRGADPPSHVQGGHANAAGGAVDQHALAALQPRLVHEAAQHSHVHDRHPGPALVAEAGGHLDAQAGRPLDDGCEGGRVDADGDDVVARREVGDPGAHPGHVCGALEAEVVVHVGESAGLLDDAQCRDDVGHVHAGGDLRELHVVGAQLGQGGRLVVQRVQQPAVADGDRPALRLLVVGHGLLAQGLVERAVVEPRQLDEAVRVRELEVRVDLALGPLVATVLDLAHDVEHGRGLAAVALAPGVFQLQRRKGRTQLGAEGPCETQDLALVGIVALYLGRAREPEYSRLLACVDQADDAGQVGLGHVLEQGRIVKVGEADDVLVFGWLDLVAPQALCDRDALCLEQRLHRESKRMYAPGAGQEREGRTMGELDGWAGHDVGVDRVRGWVLNSNRLAALEARLPEPPVPVLGPQHRAMGAAVGDAQPPPLEEAEDEGAEVTPRGGVQDVGRHDEVVFTSPKALADGIPGYIEDPVLDRVVVLEAVLRLREEARGDVGSPGPGADLENPELRRVGAQEVEVVVVVPHGVHPVIHLGQHGVLKQQLQDVHTALEDLLGPVARYQHGLHHRQRLIALHSVRNLLHGLPADNRIDKAGPRIGIQPVDLPAKPCSIGIKVRTPSSFLIVSMAHMANSFSSVTSEGLVSKVGRIRSPAGSISKSGFHCSCITFSGEASSRTGLASAVPLNPLMEKTTFPSVSTPCDDPPSVTLAPTAVVLSRISLPVPSPTNSSPMKVGR
ncbi:hypothetical protein VMCG_08353 [Cytospora schulzeri]|uniref:Uncharacterized protein n=1 Tax=Cytospora schulzeri TaxID=448051 RepID=A0A423VVC6_9PEZI|nr:hypothetical protein VMCG_08353 [Valsa malicola]